jgi:hypothetical protein
VTGRALTLALHLLRTTAVAAAVVTLEGCWCVGHDPWESTEVIDTETDADLYAVTRLENDPEAAYPEYVGLAVGAGGSVIAWGRAYDEANWRTVPFVEHSQVGDANLRAVWADGSVWWVVGDAGTAALSVDHGLTWTPIDLGTTANLRGITSIGSQLVVVGDGVMRLQGADGLWVEVPAPAGGWGELRAVHYDGSRLYVVGLAGKIWSAADPSGEWMAEDIGTDVDLFDVSSFQLDYEASTIAVVGASGTLLLRGASGWTRADTRTTTDLIACEDGGVLAAGGGLYEIGQKHRLRHIDTLTGAQALSYTQYTGALAVGTDGAAYDKPYYGCDGGRPFVVHGESVTAELRVCTRSGASEIEDALALAWARDALVEHASVASFARFALELLALGAPPKLLREVHVAIADELRHAKLCFGLARRFGGVAVEPGGLPLPVGVLERVGDPVATALALFEEGCINESLAACEAADAAGVCEDAEAREVLDTIAGDERRHATFAWAALRWLLDTYGERVRGPVRARLARVAPAYVHGSMGPTLECDECDESELQSALLAHGRLSPSRRARVHRRVFVELILPLAHALLEPNTNATLPACS